MSTSVVTITSGNGSLSVDLSTREDLDKDVVRSVLNLDRSHNWDIVDRQGSLAMVHYRRGCNMQKYGHLRGTLVDIDKKIVVIDSFGYIPTAIADHFTPVQDQLVFRDNDGRQYRWHLDDVTFHQEFRGIAMRVIWYGGVCYHLTHHRINSDKSFWGNNKKDFAQMYVDAGGPTPDQLFDCTKPYSRACYDFIILDPSILSATRQRIDAPYVVFLGQREINLSCAPEESGAGQMTFTTSSEMNGHVTAPFIYQPPALTLEQANAHLMYGYYPHVPVHPDPRQRTGESIIIHHYVDGVLDRIVKVHSSGYDWRYFMLGNKPDLTEQFYSLLNIVTPDPVTNGDWNRLYMTLPVLTVYSKVTLSYRYQTRDGILSLASVDGTDDLTDTLTRIKLLWCNFVLALPIHLQVHGIELFEEYEKNQELLLNWICAIGQGYATIKNKRKSAANVRYIYRTAYQFAAEHLPEIVSPDDHRLLHETARHNMIEMLKKESGEKLLVMIRDMNRSRRVIN